MVQVTTPMGLAHCPNPGTAKKTGAGALSGLALFIFASEKYHDKVLVITYQIGFFHALKLGNSNPSNLFYLKVSSLLLIL